MYREGKEKWINDLMGELTLEQKVGQLMVFGFQGPVLTPLIKELIKKYHVGGFRISQKFYAGSDFEFNGDKHNYPDINTYDRPASFYTKRMACTPFEYAETLNTARDYALERKDGIGLHFAFDQEGEGADFLFGQRLFPYPMGLAATRDPDLVYRAALAVGRQACALGANMIHSPVLDVNTNPNNPEIGTRAYADRPEIVAEYAIRTLRGLSEAGIIATGKHFPGRGESDKDAHHTLPIIDLDRKTLMERHVSPYKKLIDAGLPAVMAAFTAYPVFSGEMIPGATSKAIITDLLRGELGFKGIVTTDNITMRGLLDKYEISEAVIRSLLAGCDLILCRLESPTTIYLIEKVIEAVKSGRYSEKQLDESVQRILAMRWDMGLNVNGGKVDASKADNTFNDIFITETAQEAARKSVTVLKDRVGLLPLSTDKKILLIEQAHHFHTFINNRYSHPGMLWEEMRKISDNVAVCVINEKYTEEDRKRVIQRLELDRYDVIVATSYYNYRSHACMLPLLEDIKKCNNNLIVISNTPYKAFGISEDIHTALLCFCPSGRENLQAIAQVLFGNIEATARPEISIL